MTTADPGVVDARICCHGDNAAGDAAGVSGRKEDGTMTVKECARLIITGLSRHQREVVMSAKGKLGSCEAAKLRSSIKLIAPGMMENMELASLKNEVKPH